MSSTRSPRSSLSITRSEIDPDSNRNISEQIADIIRNRIATGKLRNGDPLPSVRDLCKQVGHSKVTISRAYHILRDAGLVVISGQAWLVRAQPPVRVLDSDRFAKEWARLVDSGGAPDPEQTAFCLDYGVSWREYTIQSTYEYRPALETHAQLLKVPAGTEVLWRELVELANGVKVQLRRSIMLASDVVGTPVADQSAQPVPGGTLGELWRLGCRFTEVHQSLISRPPTPREAEAMDLPSRLDVWEFTRQFIGIDSHGQERVVEVSEQVTQATGNRIVWTTRI